MPVIVELGFNGKAAPREQIFELTWKGVPSRRIEYRLANGAVFARHLEHVPATFDLLLRVDAERDQPADVIACRRIYFVQYHDGFGRAVLYPPVRDEDIDEKAGLEPQLNLMGAYNLKTPHNATLSQILWQTAVTIVTFGSKLVEKSN